MTEDEQGQIRIRGFNCIITTRPHLCGDTWLPSPLRHKRKTSLTWNLTSHFSGRHTSCCYKLFKQLLRNSTFAGSAEYSLWPWIWYVAIVRVISQVTGSIWFCNEPRLRSQFARLPSRRCVDIWVPHSGRAALWKGRRSWGVSGGHSIHEMLISLWGECLRMPWVSSHERDQRPPCTAWCEMILPWLALRAWGDCRGDRCGKEHPPSDWRLLTYGESAMSLRISGLPWDWHVCKEFARI